MILSGLRRRGQSRESVLLDEVYVSGRDSAAGVYIIAEVGACHRLKGLRLTQIGIAAGNNPTAVDVTDQHTHLRPDNVTVVACSVRYTVQSNGDILTGAHVFKVDRVLVWIRSDRTVAYHACSTGGVMTANAGTGDVR